MLNQCIVVGRIKDIYYDENIIEINCPRQTQGEYDIITCKLSDSMKNNLRSYCHIGDVVGVKGRLISEGTTMFVQTDKFTYLSHSTREGGEDNGSSE